jgi:hypothetical protein
MRLLLFSLLLALSGCSLFGGGATDDLADARRQWADADLPSYTMTLTRSCFCGPGFSGPFEVRVENGAVVSASLAGETVPTDRVLTVEALFDLLDSAYRESADRVEVTYDIERGFPSDLFIDYEENVADEEIGYTVRDVRGL